MKDEKYENLIDDLIALRAKVTVLQGKEDGSKEKDEPLTLECTYDIGHSMVHPTMTLCSPTKKG